MGKKVTATTTRSPIVSVLGHVDHGKSSVLDAIRETNILATEAGAITQAIGASIIPLNTIRKRCGPLFDQIKNVSIPGLLFIDTPGHAAFSSLRKRGGALADIAILVVDINEGFKPQTREAIEILKNSKTPFIVAANKIDLIPGYKHKHERVLASIKSQDEKVITEFETRMYKLVGLFHEEFSMPAERFDRVDDFTKQLAIVPTSAMNSWGIPELLMVLTALAQKYLEKNLLIDVSGLGKGSVLEVKESKGLGTTIDVILYDGIIKRNDIIVIGGLQEATVTKVRALLEPAPHAEMRDSKAKYQPLQQATAATGIKIAAPGLEPVIPGMPLVVATQETLEEAKEQVQSAVDDVIVSTDKEGIVIKADTLGSLEAMQQLLKEEGIPVRKAGIGPITKKDLADAQSNNDVLTKVILGFNVKGEESDTIKVVTNSVIYRLIEDFKDWQEETKSQLQAQQLSELIRPCKIEILQSCIFRISNPCILGIEILEGVLQSGTTLMKADGTRLAAVKSVEQDKKNVAQASKGLQVAISIPGVNAERQKIEEYMILYSDVPEEDFRKLKELKEHLTTQEKEVLKEIAEIKRKQKPMWGL